MCQTNELQDVENEYIDSNDRHYIKDDLLLKKNGLYMDEALSKTEFGLFNYILIFLSAMALCAVLTETAGITFVLPVSQCDLNLTTQEKGVLAAISFVGIICSSHLWGFLADTKGRRRVIQPTLLIAFLMSVASSFVHNFYLFATLRFLNGFFISGCSATIYAYLSEFHNNTQRGRAIMGSSVIYGVSCMLLPLIAWSVINQDWQFDVPLIGVTYKPWRLFLVVCSLPGLLSFIILTFLPESPKFVLGQGKQAEAYQILRQMNRINNGKNSSFEPFEIYEEAESIENRKRILETKNSRIPFLSSVWIQTAPLFKPPYLFSTVLICLIQFLIYATTNGFYMFFAEILNKMATILDDFTNQRVMMCDIISMNPIHDNPTINGTIDQVCTTKLELETLEQGLILEILYATSFSLIGLLINKVGKFPILFVILVGTGASGIVCVLSNIPLAQISGFILLMLCGVAPNIINAATVEIYPTALRAMAVCISLMFGRLGSAIGANVVAILLDNHCEFVFYLSGTTVIGAGILTFFIPKIHEKVTKHEPAQANQISQGPRTSIITIE